jgi:hypothetical protein
MQLFRGLSGQQVWVRRFEHLVLRVVSLGFSLASAHAIRWFFAPLDRVDVLQPIITWMIAIGFGVLGYFVSRGLALRLMNKERIWAYLPICLVVELVEVFCNYALAAAVIQHATWLHAVPVVQRTVLTALTYVVLAIIPLVSVLLAVVDMDLERSKHSAGSMPRPAAAAAPMSPLLGGSAATGKGQPRWNTVATPGPAPARTPAPVASYGQGYQGQAPAMASTNNAGDIPLVPFAPVRSS